MGNYNMNASLSKLVFMMLSYQNIAMCNISQSKNRRDTVEAGVDIFMEIQHELQPDLSIEIGARDAGFSLMMREQFPALDVLAFEGSSEACAYFEKKYKFKDKGIVYINKVVSDKSGFANFNIVSSCADNANIPGIDGRNSLSERDYSGLSYTARRVQSITGDDIVEDYKSNNTAVWIDVEGSARPVLLGLEQSLAARKISSIYIELELTEVWKNQWLCFDVIDFLIKYGYIPIYKDSEINIQGNFIFIHASLLSGKIIEIISNNIYRHQQDILTQYVHPIYNKINEIERNIVNVCSVISTLSKKI